MKKFPLTVISALLLVLVFSLPAASNGNGGNGNHGHNGTVTVTISPSTSSLQVGQSQQFTATVSGTRNKALNWLVNGTLGGDATVGTISSYGVYTAPAFAPSSSVAVTAQSAVQPAATASATVSITPPPPISVSISPTSSSLQAGQSQQFAATVSGTTNTAVNWLVSGIPGGNSTVGTISSSGLYSAPATVPSSSVTVTAQSAFQSTASASATVSIMPTVVSISISPTSAALQVGQSDQFSATVSGTSNTGVAWLVNGTPGGNSTVGTISSSGMYAAPSAVPSSPVAVTARSNAQSTSSASATVSIMPATVSVSISPTNSSVQVGQAEQFSATVSGASSNTVNWLVSGIPGGNSSAGTITSTGLYTAPASVPSGSVTVTAQSSANPSSSASAGVTITQPVAHYVNLAWTASSSPVAGYNVYRGAQSTGPFTKLNSPVETATVYTDNAVNSGQTYYYATTAVDSTGLESSYSNVAQAVIP